MALRKIQLKQVAYKFKNNFDCLQSTYKFKGAFFRHERRISTKFGTHVRIETRLALT